MTGEKKKKKAPNTTNITAQPLLNDGIQLGFLGFVHHVRIVSAHIGPSSGDACAPESINLLAKAERR